MTDRGVSETLGFVLVFALVVGTIGIVYATGISGLTDVQEAERVNNVERAFDVFADNLEAIHREGSQSRATEVRLAGGSLGIGEEVSIEIESGDDVNVTQFEPIVYEDDDGRALVYEGGAVIRSDPGGSTMIAEPGWVVGENRSVIPIVDTSGDGSVSGEGTVLIVGERQGRRALQEPFAVSGEISEPVNVTVTSPRAAAWQGFFEAQGYTEVESDLENDSVTYRIETDRLHVTRTGVRVNFNR